jgi:hypothetical protein
MSRDAAVAAVSRARSAKPLKLLVRRFTAAVGAVVAAGPEKPGKIKVRQFRGGCGVVPPYPHALRRALERAAGAKPKR